MTMKINKYKSKEVKVKGTVKDDDLKDKQREVC